MRASLLLTSVRQQCGRAAVGLPMAHGRAPHGVPLPLAGLPASSWLSTGVRVRSVYLVQRTLRSE